jgi:hypothetical protein
VCWSDARDTCANGIGEMKQNSDETAKKTDAICTWVFGEVQGIHV